MHYQSRQFTFFNAPICWYYGGSGLCAFIQLRLCLPRWGGVVKTTWVCTSREQYMALVKPMELEFDKNTNSSIFDKLLAELQLTASTPHERAPRKQEIFRLMRQLQERKRLQQLRWAGGTVIRDKLRIASELSAFGSSIMQGGAKSQHEIESYLTFKGVHFRLA